MDRFDLEQHILECWQMCDDLEVLIEQNATLSDISCLSPVYRYKFKQLFSTFTTLVHEGKLISKGHKDEQE
jgi:hypothetical protein